ncbi:N-acylneuraminate cytidylyltransferase [Culicoides brevitarsis]|uniref:N-acylneuraminate cytidylyltransferase n=1 Tax=Culicoides brevitarsis TaxID=469753 RepID=UPI00307BD818
MRLTAISIFVLFLGNSIADSNFDNCKVQKSQQNDPQVTALILARGGSKGIPLKNIARIGNQTLMGRTLDTINLFGRFNDVWVSTDHALIADVAKKHCAKVFKRSPEFAKDETASIVSVQEFINQTFTSPIVALIQVTSPFLREKYLAKAFDVIQNGKHCVFTVTRSHKLRWAQTNGRILPLNFDPEKRPRRQDWSGELVENGMFYMASKDLLIEGKFQDEDCGIVEVDKKDSIDIDTPEDLKLVEFLLAMQE